MVQVRAVGGLAAYRGAACLIAGGNVFAEPRRRPVTGTGLPVRAPAGSARGHSGGSGVGICLSSGQQCFLQRGGEDVAEPAGVRPAGFAMTGLGLTGMGLTVLPMTGLGLTGLGLTGHGLTVLPITELGLTGLGVAGRGPGRLAGCLAAGLPHQAGGHDKSDLADQARWLIADAGCPGASAAKPGDGDGLPSAVGDDDLPFGAAVGSRDRGEVACCLRGNGAKAAELACHGEEAGQGPPGDDEAQPGAGRAAG